MHMQSMQCTFLNKGSVSQLFRLDIYIYLDRPDGVFRYKFCRSLFPPSRFLSARKSIIMMRCIHQVVYQQYVCPHRVVFFSFSYMPNANERMLILIISIALPLID